MTATITIVNPFALNKKKLYLESLLLIAIANIFPNHRIGNVFNNRGYQVFRETDGKPWQTCDITKNIKQTIFCLIAPKLPDNRKRFLSFPVGEIPEADVLCTTEIIYSANDLNIIEIQFKVFGTHNKDAFLKLANDIVTDGILGLYIQSIVVSIESEYPKKETLF